MDANISVIFDSGLGEVTIACNGNELKVESTTAKPLVLNNVNSGDNIEVDGSCTGTCEITIDQKTDPVTPYKHNAGSIHINFIVLKRLN